MIRNKPILHVETPAGTRYTYGPRTYRTRQEAEAAKAAHEAEYDRHITQFRRDAAAAEAEMQSSLQAAGLAGTEENRRRVICLRCYKNVLRMTGGDRKRAAAMFRGTHVDENE